eukprot:402385-Amphidinium_carterae.1
MSVALLMKLITGCLLSATEADPRAPDAEACGARGTTSRAALCLGAVTDKDRCALCIQPRS